MMRLLNRIGDRSRRYDGPGFSSLSLPSLSRATMGRGRTLLVSTAIGVVLTVTIWVNTLELARHRTTASQVALFARETVSLARDDRREWTSRRSLVESENWDEANGRCGDAADFCTLTFRFPPQPIWESKVAINGTRGVLDITQPFSGKTDAGFACLLGDAVLGEDHWITKAEPLIDAFPDPTRGPGKTFDVMHHMDLFFCEGGVTTTREYAVHDPAVCSHDGFVQTAVPLSFDGYLRERFVEAMPKVSPACIFGAVYDRGAGPLTLPTDLGFLVGPSTSRAKEIIIQAHYLVPENYDRVTELTGPVWDNSGYRITLRRTKTEGEGRQPAGILGLNDYGLWYPKGEPRLHHSYEIGPEGFGEAVAGDFARYGAIQPVAMHLHAHSMTKQIWIDHLRNGTKIGEYGRHDDFISNGSGQDFFLLPPEDRTRPLVRGDALRVNCVVDPSDAGTVTVYGVSHRTEMCSAIFVFKNHDPTIFGNFEMSNLISTCSDKKVCLDPPQTNGGS